MSVQQSEIETKLAPVLEALGLFCFGWFAMADAPFTGRKAVLIGNHAKDGKHKMWEVLKSSDEYLDGLPDPMNRWTERQMKLIADAHDAVALYPFGQQLWPFQRYAKAATGMQSSPLGLLIHPDFGLWQAFRAVLVFDQPVTLELPQRLNHPCDTCNEKPCLSACPVLAFSAEGFDEVSCRAHLASCDEPDCMGRGCQARSACPIGFPYSQDQLQFHMKAFKH